MALYVPAQDVKLHVEFGLKLVLRLTGLVCIHNDMDHEETALSVLSVIII